MGEENKAVDVHVEEVGKFRYLGTVIAVSYTHLDVYKRQCIYISLAVSLKGPAAELLQKVPPDSQNIYAELIKALELRYGDKHLREVYYAQLRTRRQRSGESLQEFEASIDILIRLAYPEAPEDFRIRFTAVSYTHLDVYKRQVYVQLPSFFVVVLVPLFLMCLDIGSNIG